MDVSFSKSGIFYPTVSVHNNFTRQLRVSKNVHGCTWRPGPLGGCALEYIVQSKSCPLLVTPNEHPSLYAALVIHGINGTISTREILSHASCSNRSQAFLPLLGFSSFITAEMRPSSFRPPLRHSSTTSLWLSGNKSRYRCDFRVQ